jgi:hypothetical protein
MVSSSLTLVWLIVCDLSRLRPEKHLFDSTFEGLAIS